MAIGQELLNVPMGDMIRQMAFAIAEGQVQLDASSIEVAEMMGGLKLIYDEKGNQVFDDSRIFFGFDLMTVREAEAYIAADEAMTGGDKTALTQIINSQKPGTSDTDLIRVPTRLSMLELGFTPTFYQFVDTIIEVKIAIKITREYTTTTTSRNTQTRNKTFNKGSGIFGAIFGGKTRSSSQVSTSQVDASYSSKYNYSAEGSSLLRTKLVPLPPPPILEERIRRQMDEDVERRRKKLDAELAKSAPPPPPPSP
ncbi:hypothetical protein [Allosphingosinicella deserti]|uniref:Ribosomal protein S12 methylthiotransferase rimO n=1 Tax=Allosphingosinicella deserti TaxID=2116704 RepID=A0A2P7QLJ5_9SPHN|nr:hypothetical protein [Sphingomonas deserti]PSJ38825.1 hypothetical protein C7I55_15980 [Sphingomonas deserti]